MILETLKKVVASALVEVIGQEPGLPVNFDYPENPEHGDFSTNIAMVLASRQRTNPFELAEQIVAALPVDSMIHKAVAVKPGFINFFLSIDSLWQSVLQAADNPSFGRSILKDEKTTLIEYGQPNTHKVPHIGHLFSYCYGESLSRLLEATGHKVYRANYQGDVGLHVAKCLWAITDHLTAELEAARTGSLADKVNFLQTAYQDASQAYENDPIAKASIDQLNGSIYRHEPAIDALWQETRSWSLEYYQQFEARLGVHYDKSYFESQTSELGKATVLAHRGDVFWEDQGAVIFKGDEVGLHTRVFINQLGNPTYEAKDIGLIQLKKQDFDFDEAIITTAIEQAEYFKVVKAAIERLFPDLVGKIRHISYGMINLTTGKMSSRTGKILTAISLIETVKEQVNSIIEESRQYEGALKEEIAERVAVAAIKYSFLKTAAGKNISFDLESSVAFEGNSGPYLLYTYARCHSLLAKAERESKVRAENIDSLRAQQLTEGELAVLRLFYRFPIVVNRAASEFAPHYLCTYLYQLAASYSFLYNQQPILSDDSELTGRRLLLTKAVAETLKTGLGLIGIEVLDQI